MNQLLLELSMYLFNTLLNVSFNALQECYMRFEDILKLYMIKLNAEKKTKTFFDKFATFQTWQISTNYIE